VLVTILTLPVALITVIGPALWQVGNAPFARFEARTRILQVGQPYRLPVDSTISPLAAGQAYYTLAVVGRSEPPETYERPPSRRIDQSWIPDQDNNPFGKPDALERLISRAGTGFDAQETDFLKRIASHPGFAEAAIVARASSIDYLGARLTPDHTIGGFVLPIPSLLEMRRAIQAHVATAALELSQGQPTEAEAMLREGISLGSAVAIEGHSLIEALIGAAAVEIGLKGLEDFYSLTGRAPEARVLRENREAAAAGVQDIPVPPNADDFLLSDAIAARRDLVEILRDRQRLQAERWEAVNLLALAPCSNARELVFGPANELSRALEIARTSLARFPSEQRLLENILATADAHRLESRAVLPWTIGIVSRGFDRLFGNTRVTNCTLLMTGDLFTVL
jgi:hypothetical protein